MVGGFGVLLLVKSARLLVKNINKRQSGSDLLVKNTVLLVMNLVLLAKNAGFLPVKRANKAGEVMIGGAGETLLMAGLVG